MSGVYEFIREIYDSGVQTIRFILVDRSTLDMFKTFEYIRIRLYINFISTLVDDMWIVYDTYIDIYEYIEKERVFSVINLMYI